MSYSNNAAKVKEQKEEEKRERLDALVKKLSTGDELIFVYFVLFLFSFLVFLLLISSF